MKKVNLLMLTIWLATGSFCQQSITNQLDEMLGSFAQRNKFNGSVLIAKRGEIMLDKGYGIKNAKGHILNDTNGVFRIYSITKTFTSTLVMKLVDGGRLSLSDQLSKFYPDYPEGDRITIKQLLSHTAGIYDYTRGNDMKEQNEQTMVAFLKTKNLDFRPGTGWSYSNSGYWLLGFIIEKVSGLSYEGALHKYIFDPLGMTHSGLDFKNLVNKDKVVGYEKLNAGEQKESVIYDPPGPYAAGAIYSTVGDMYRYYLGLRDSKIISDSSLHLAFKAMDKGYGLGWISGNYEGKQLVSHSGGGAGFRTNFMMIPAEDICIIIFANLESSNTDMITMRLIDILFNKPYKIPVEIKLSEKSLGKFIGTYQTKNPDLIFYIGVENKRLSVQVSRQPKTEVYAETANRFFAEEADATVEFKKDSTGKNDIIEIIQRGRKIIGSKIFPTWGIVGDATTAGWEGSEDLEMKEDSKQNGIWWLKGISLKAGEFKFRFNNDWTISYGINNSEKKLVQDGGNIKVDQGTYDIMLDLRRSSLPAYVIVKSSKN